MATKRKPPAWYVFKFMFTGFELGCLWFMLKVLGIEDNIQWWRVLVFGLLLAIYTILDRAETDTLDEFKED